MSCSTLAALASALRIDFSNRVAKLRLSPFATRQHLGPFLMFGLRNLNEKSLMAAAKWQARCRVASLSAVCAILSSCATPTSPVTLRQDAVGEIVGSATTGVPDSRWSATYAGVYGINGEYGYRGRPRLPAGTYRLLLMASHYTGVKSLIPMTLTIERGKSYRVRSFWHKDGNARYWIEDSTSGQRLWSGEAPVFTCLESQTEKAYREAAEALGWKPKPGYRAFRLY